MNLLLAQCNPTVGAISQNVLHMLDIVSNAQKSDIQVVVFQEQAVAGYPAKDLLFNPSFISRCLEANEHLINASSCNVLVIWGNISKNPKSTGKPLFNSAFAAFNGQLIAQAHKANLPTYDVFDEARYFEPGTDEEAIPVFYCLGKTFALSVCEDMWNHPCFEHSEIEQVTPVKYHTQPLNKLNAQPAEVLINLSASPYVMQKPEKRFALIKRLSAALNTPIVYVNQVGGNDDLLFDGHSSLTFPSGKQVCNAGFQENSLRVSLSEPALSPTAHITPCWEEELIEALCLGIRDYVSKTGFKDVYLGLSGGIDSSLVAYLAQRALGPHHVTGIAMPGPYSSEHSLEDAEALAKHLGLSYKVVPITPIFESFLLAMGQTERLMDLAEQNLQARTRGTVLMTHANRYNGLVLSTGNKSEIAMGYSTLYGDSCGALAPIGDVYKTQVYALCHYINQSEGNACIPQSVLEKPPSAELAPNQTDQDTLPPYPILDTLLKAFLEEGVKEGALGDLPGFGYDMETVTRTLSQVIRNEYKRQQMPPVLKVSKKAFGSGRVFPIVSNIDLSPVQVSKDHEETPVFKW